MAFDPKEMLNSKTFAIAGGVVVGMGIFTLISAAVDHLIRPMFNIVFEHGVLVVSRERGIALGCGGFIAAILVAVACVIVGFLIAKAATKS